MWPGGKDTQPGIGNGNRPLSLLSDRDHGLSVVDYTGKKPKVD